MTPFAEQLKTLSVPELEKLKRILMLLAHDANLSFDKLLEQIRAPQSALSQSDADLIDSRSYELEIYNHLDAASAHKQAMQEFKAGKLHKPKIPRPPQANHACSPYGRRRQCERGDRPRASRHACKLAYEACNRSATTPNRSTTGQRFSSPSLSANSFAAGATTTPSGKTRDAHTFPTFPTTNAALIQLRARGRSGGHQHDRRRVLNGVKIEGSNSISQHRHHLRRRGRACLR